LDSTNKTIHLLRLPGWNCRCVDSVSDTSDASSNNELRGGTAIGRCTGDLDNHTNDHDKCTEEDRFAAAEFITNKEDGDGTQEATTSVDGDDKTFVSTVAFDLRKRGLERGGGDDTAHNTLVVSKEQEVGNSNNSNKNLKHPSGLPPVGGHTGVVVLYAWHGGGWSKQQKLERSTGGLPVGETVHL
jgi:hypothetical protein